MSASASRRIGVAIMALCAVASGVAAQGARSGRAALPAATPEAVGMSSARLQRIRAALDREIDGDRIPGAVVAVARHGQLVYYESFGYLDKVAGTPMPKDAIFAIASMTKPIFAVGAMSLYEEGRLLMDEAVSTYLPVLDNTLVAVDGDPSRTRSARRKPTIEDLMRHTSGWVTPSRGTSAVHDLYPPGPTADDLTGPEYLEALSQLPFAHEPGTTWEYGPGFDILGLAIERVSGQSMSEFLRARLWEPLGMVDTAFTIPASKATRQARPLPRDPISGAAQTVRNKLRPLEVECGGGCLTSTASDYVRFAQMLLNGGELDDARVLGRATVAYLTADHTSPDMDLTRLHAFPVDQLAGHGFGLGVSVRRSAGVGGAIGSPGTFHWSGAEGTTFWVDPVEDLVIVFMAQTPGQIRTYYRQLVPGLVYQALVD